MIPLAMLLIPLPVGLLARSRRQALTITLAVYASLLIVQSIVVASFRKRLPAAGVLARPDALTGSGPSAPAPWAALARAQVRNMTAHDTSGTP